MTSRLFEEAIADAKKLKEVAEDSAKQAILEAVTPRIREFIEQQLLEKDEEEVEKGEEKPTGDDLATAIDEDVVLDESAIASLIGMLGGQEIIDSLGGETSTLEESIDHVVNGMTARDKEKLFDLANKINESADKLSAKNINNNTHQESGNMSNDKFYEVDLRALREEIDKEMKSELYSEEEQSEGTYGMEELEGMEEIGGMEETDSVEEMLAEIKLMLDLGDEIEEDQLPEELRGMLIDEDEDDEPLEMDSEEEDSEDPMADEALEDEPAEAEEELPGLEDLNEIFDVDPRMLRQELARVKRQIREGKVDHHFGGKGEGKVGVDGAFGGKGNKNAGVKGAFGGGKEGQDPFTNPPQMNKLNEAIRQLRRQNRSQKEKLNKYRSAVVTLREQLEDLNLFNAKLLYVNKLLQNNSLTESQKKSVIKALDEAKSLDETKSLYRSLTETLGSKKTLSESKRYGSSSRTTKSGGGNLSESAGEVSRWQRLAGLK